MNLFGRTYTLNVNGAQVLPPMRVVFKVKKSIVKDPNTLDLKIYNLSESTRSKFQGFGLPVILAAGYGTSSSVIFAGNSRTIDHVQEGPNWVTHILCGDGEESARFSDFYRNFKPGVPFGEVLREGAKALGVGGGNVEKFITSGVSKIKNYARGYVAAGKANAIFDDLVRGAGAEWSIQDGQIQILLPNQTADGLIPLVSPGTGLVNSPEHSSPTKKNKVSYVKVRSLLRHEFRCGGALALASRSVNGQFKIAKLEHSGDTDGQDWYSDLEVVSL